MTWLARTPTAIVSACLTMLPRLQAEESALGAERVAVGNVTLEDKSRRAITRTWEREANGGRRVPRKKASREVLGAVGIGVRIQAKAS